MNDKTIYYVHTGLWPSPSPSSVFVTGTVWGLAHHSPTELIIRNNSSSSDGDVLRSITGAELPDKLTITRIGLNGKTPGHTGFFRKAAHRIGTLAKKSGAGAVITRNVGFLPYLVYIRHRYGIPCFFEAHDFYSDLSLRPDLKKNSIILKKHFYEKIFLPRLDGIICLTETQAGFFRERYKSVPVVVAPTGLMRVEHAAADREKTFCYTGSLDTHKGLGTVLSALALTADKDIRLLVIGGKNEHEKLKFMELAALMGVADRVHISMWVHHSDIGYRINSCVAGLVPLRDTPYNRYFTSPLKILDYFSHCLPVIASDLPSVREYVGDGTHGMLFEPDNPEHLAETLDRYIAGNCYKSMSPEVARHAENYLWTERGKYIVEFVRDTARE